MAYRNTKPALTDRERAACIFMQQNFAKLNTSYEVNHNPINTSQGHKYLEFYPIANPNTPSADEFVLFGRAGVYGATNNIELCTRRPSNGDIIEFTSSQTGDEGWYALPSGMLIKWKWNHAIGAGSSGVQTFTWTTGANYPAFSEAYQGFVWVSPDAAATDPDAWVYSYQATTTQVEWIGTQRSVKTAFGDVPKAYKVNIIAIGKGPGV